MSPRKKDVVQPRETAAVQADDLNALKGVEIVRPTEIPMGIRLASSSPVPANAAEEPSNDPGQAEPADAPPTKPAPAIVQEPSSSTAPVAQEPSGSPVQADVAQVPPSDAAPAEPADAPPSSPLQASVAEPSSIIVPATAGNDLTAQFAQQYKSVCKIDDAVAQFEVKKRRTPEYWALGKIAVQLKDKLGHGKWLPFLAEHGYVERTIQRAMNIYTLFRDRKDDCAGLTLEQAEQTGKVKKPEAETPRKRGGVPVAPATKQPEAATPPEVTDGTGEAEGEDEAPATEHPLAATATKQGETASTAEVNGGEDGDQDEDEAREEKTELLYGVLSEAIDPSFAVTDAEREAFASFMAAVGDEDRAMRVLLHRIWNMI
jgi:hypothetical protein